MRFRMLGPLLVDDGASWSAIHAAQQRLVAAVLLLEAGCGGCSAVARAAR